MTKVIRTTDTFTLSIENLKTMNRILMKLRDAMLLERSDLRRILMSPF